MIEVGIGIKTKRCTKCGKEKPLTEFYRSKKGKYGRYSICVICKKEYRKQEYINHRDKVLERSKRNQRKLRLEILKHYGGDPPKCACPGCDEDHIEFLTIDHINNNGAEHLREIGVGAGSAFYYWLKRSNYPRGFQVLCWNCNCAKGRYGYCPHEREVKEND